MLQDRISFIQTPTQTPAQKSTRLDNTDQYEDMTTSQDTSSASSTTPNNINENSFFTHENISDGVINSNDTNGFNNNNITTTTTTTTTTAMDHNNDVITFSTVWLSTEKLLQDTEHFRIILGPPGIPRDVSSYPWQKVRDEWKIRKKSHLDPTLHCQSRPLCILCGFNPSPMSSALSIRNDDRRGGTGNRDSAAVHGHSQEGANHTVCYGRANQSSHNGAQSCDQGETAGIGSTMPSFTPTPTCSSSGNHPQSSVMQNNMNGTHLNSNDPIANTGTSVSSAATVTCNGCGALAHTDCVPSCMLFTPQTIVRSHENTVVPKAKKGNVSKTVSLKRSKRNTSRDTQIDTTEDDTGDTDKGAEADARVPPSPYWRCWDCYGNISNSMLGHLLYYF